MKVRMLHNMAITNLLLLVLLTSVGGTEYTTSYSRVELTEEAVSMTEPHNSLDVEEVTMQGSDRHRDRGLPTLDTHAAEDMLEGGERDTLLFRFFICNAFRRGFGPGNTCRCRRPGFLRNKRFVVDCQTTIARCIFLIYCFTLKYHGEFYFRRDDIPSTSELCLTEVNSNFDVLCIKGVHCGDDLGCYESCTAEVGQQQCNSCAVCPGGSGFIVDCKNVNEILAYEDCPAGESRSGGSLNMEGGLQTILSDSVFSP